MNNRITLTPYEARDYGLVHEIQSQLFSIDANLNVIRKNIQQISQGIPFGITIPSMEAFTRSQDLDIGAI